MEAVTGDRYTWYIDPIDGTKSFISGMPLYGLLMALRDNRAEQTVLGMIDIPALGERWIGHSGQAALNGRPVRVSGCRSLAEAQVYTTSPDIFAPADWAAYERVSLAARFRRFGGDCYIYGLMAAGHCDLALGVQSGQPGDADVNTREQGRFGNMRQNMTPQWKTQNR